MMLKEFFKPNRFKIIFSTVLVIIALIVFLVAKMLEIDILETVFYAIYFPASLLIHILCIILAGGEEACYNLLIVKLFSIPIFLFYVYILSCLINIKGTRESLSLKLGAISIILVISMTIIHDEFFWRFDTDWWLDVLILLPATVTAAFGLIHGIKGIKSPKRIFALLGILLSLITLAFVYILLTAPGAC